MNTNSLQFEDLRAWAAARQLTNSVYTLCQRQPLARDYGLCDQLRRAAVSVMNNIEEGWETLHAKEKAQFYNFARRSCGEVRSMSYILLDNQLISSDDHMALRNRCISSGKLVSGLLRTVEQN